MLERVGDGKGQVIADGLAPWSRVAQEHGIDRLPFRFGNEALGNTIEEDLELQADRYIDRDFPRALGLTPSALKDRIMALKPPIREEVNAQRDRFRIPTVYVKGIPFRTQYQLAGIKLPYGMRSEAFHNPKVYTAEVELVWMQDGSLFLGKSLIEAVESTAENEGLAGLDHGVGLLMARPALLSHHSVYLPGSQSTEEEDNTSFRTVPRLYSETRDGSKPVLEMHLVGRDDSLRSEDFTGSPLVGSVTFQLA